MTGTAAGAIGGWGANHLGGWRIDRTFTDFEHKLAHGFLGAAMGAILDSHHPLRGMVAGGLGGFVAESTAALTQDFLGHPWAGNAGILSGPLAAFLLDQNVDVASATASNAIVNNFWWAAAAEGAAATATAGKIAWEIYVLTHEEQVQATKQEICTYVAEKVGCSPSTVENLYEGAMMAGSGVHLAKKGWRALVQQGNKQALREITSGGYEKPQSQSGLQSTPFTKLTKEYVHDMETRSSLKITEKQRLILKSELQAKRFEKLSGNQYLEHKKIYDKPATKEQIRQEWERNTGQNWPTYTENRYGQKGNTIYEAGDPYQIHHIIHQKHGGPHEWWNAHPVPLEGHQGGIHGSGAPGQILHQ